MSRRFLLSPIIVLLVLALAACGGQAPAPAASAPTDVVAATVAPAITEAATITEVPAPTEAPAGTEEPASTDVPASTEIPMSTATAASDASPATDSLVVYSGRSEALVAPIIAQFAEASGIKVDVRYGSTAEIAATLLEEGTVSPADIFFAQDPGGLAAVANAGLFAPLPDELLARVPERFRSEDGLWAGISGRARVVVYNTAKVKPEDLPADIFDFTDPKWSGRIGWAPTNGSLQAMVTAMRATWGEERTREWLTGIQANQPMVYEGNAPVVEGVAAGEVDVGLVNHYYLYRFLSEQGEGFAARNHFLQGGGPGSLIMVAGAGRLTNGPNEVNALRFLQFMLSPVAQQYFAGQTNEYPLVEGVVTPAGLPPLADLEAVALNIDMSDLEDLQGTLTLMQDAGVLE